MRGINLLLTTQRVNQNVIYYRKVAITVSILLASVVATVSVAVFLVDLFYMGNLKKVQNEVANKEQAVREYSKVESMSAALKQKASAIYEIKSKSSDYEKTVDVIVQVIGSDAILKDVTLDTKKVSASFSSLTSESLITVLDRLNSQSLGRQKLRNISLVSLGMESSTGWRATITAEVI